jgi:hypothetical protein
MVRRPRESAGEVCRVVEAFVAADVDSDGTAIGPLRRPGFTGNDGYTPPFGADTPPGSLRKDGRDRVPGLWRLE